MSANNPSTSGAPKEPPKLDPSLDITSEHFDPLKALYAGKEELPNTGNAKIYDNIGKYESVMNAQRNPLADEKNKKSKLTNTRNIGVSDVGKSKNTAENPFQRKFLPHQLMVQGSGKTTRHNRNLFTRYEEENGFEGPLARLQQSMKDKTRVKIYTRNASQINGHMTGIVMAFDKHWNIALSDVFEVWKRRKTNLCSTSDFDSVEDCSARLRQLRVKLPEVQVKSLNRKQVECSRHLAQVLVRGEQVALIVMLDK